jgi:urease accessory protein
MKVKDTMVTAAGSQVIATESEGGSRSTRIAVEMIDGRARINTLYQGYFLAGRPLQISGNWVRLALVGIHLAMLAGDVIDVQIQVGAGAVLEVIEPSGMVAYDADGQRSIWRLAATVGAGATLIWQGATFVAAQGSNVQRNTELVLRPNARVLLKETLVLGRSGESNIRLNSRTQALLKEQELLVEELAMTPDTWRLPGIGGASKVISTVMALGMRPSGDTTGAQRLDLAGPGALWRSLAAAAHSAEMVAEPVFRRWCSEALERLGS